MKLKATFMAEPHGGCWALLEDGLIVMNGYDSEAELREHAGQIAADEIDKIQAELTEIADRQEHAEQMMRFANGEIG